MDHINGNGLDNRRENLRPANNSIQAMNRGKIDHYRGRPCYSKYKGVHKSRDRWAVHIAIDWKQIHVGCYPTQELAAIAYNEAAVELFGEYAQLNLVEEA